jgi:hypothetical protein
LEEESNGGERREETEREFKRGKSILYCREAKRGGEEEEGVGRVKGERSAGT